MVGHVHDENQSFTNNELLTHNAALLDDAGLIQQLAEATRRVAFSGVRQEWPD